MTYKRLSNSISCILCKKEFSTKGLFTHFSRTHLKIARDNNTEKNRISRKITADSRNTTARISYDLIPNYCNECKSPLNYEKRSNKFCSHACAAIYNNIRKDYSKFKPGPKPGFKPINIQPKFTKIKQCEVCGKFHPGSGRSCSKKCKSKILSMAMNKRIDNGWNPQEHRCRSKPSFLEKSFEEWLISINYTDYVKNKTFRCGNKIYYGDFFFPNKKILIELDGKQHEESIEYDSSRDRRIMEHHKVKTIRISYKEYMQKSKIDFVLESIK